MRQSRYGTVPDQTCSLVCVPSALYRRIAVDLRVGKEYSKLLVTYEYVTFPQINYDPVKCSLVSE